MDKRFTRRYAKTIESADWLTMASSFHWTNFEKATEGS